MNPLVWHAFTGTLSIAVVDYVDGALLMRGITRRPESRSPAAEGGES